MNIRKTITSEIEWNTIKKAQADGKLQELLQVGDELDITMKTGEELTVQAVGTTEHGRVKERPGNGTWWHWLRSPYGSNSTYFCSVGSNGGANYNTAG